MYVSMDQEEALKANMVEGSRGIRRTTAMGAKPIEEEEEEHYHIFKLLIDQTGSVRNG